MRSHRRRRLLAVGLVLSLFLAGVATIATARVVVANPVEVDTGSAISETASAPFKFDVCSFEMVATGVTVSVTFFNADTIPHTFTIVKAANYTIPVSDTPAALGGFVHTYGVWFNMTATPGGYANGTFTSPTAPGWYEFVCMESGHFESGMYGFIAFGENLPSNLTCSSGTPGAGLVVFIIIGTIVTLTVLAIVLGFVVGRRKGAEHEMPPERLGYPEPPVNEPLPPSPPRPPHAP